MFKVNHPFNNIFRNDLQNYYDLSLNISFNQLIGLLGLGGSGTLIARGSSEFMIINTILAAESLILLIMSVFLLIGTWKVHLSLDRSLLF